MANKLKEPKYRIGQKVWAVCWKGTKYIPCTFIIKTIAGVYPTSDVFEYRASEIPGSVAWEESSIRLTEESAKKLAEEKNFEEKIRAAEEDLKWNKERIAYLQKALKDFPVELYTHQKNTKQLGKRLERLKKKYKEVFGVLPA